MMCRTFRALALIATIVVVCAGCDWRTSGYGPDHTSFNPTESAISVANVTHLVRRYPVSDGNGCGAETCSSPAVANGTAYVGTGRDLVARDAGTGDLQWSGHTGGGISSSPAVVDGLVYVGSDDFKLYAFDAAGTTNCSGSPRICAPLWTANTAGKVRSSPTVANGVVYVGSDDQTLYALSAAGTTNCSGSPKVCHPLWQSVVLVSAVGAPAIANGVVYVGAGWLFAFDAAGTTSCSGSPKICAPLWHSAPNYIVATSPAVANGIVYAGGAVNGTASYRLLAFSAAGTTRCSKRPNVIDPSVLELVCDPLWGGPVPAVKTAPAIANGVVYISGENFASFEAAGALLVAFDATGVTNCFVIGSEKFCNPLWTSELTLGTFEGAWSPVVANGVVYVTDQWLVDFFSPFAGIHAFDAAGTTNCSGTPKTCSPLWSDIVVNPQFSSPQVSSPVVANGAVYLNAGAIYKYALP
jgi:outer membrane protein assembly factor BamB